jgi:hypothetical protein
MSFWWQSVRTGICYRAGAALLRKHCRVADESCSSSAAVVLAAKAVSHSPSFFSRSAAQVQAVAQISLPAPLLAHVAWQFRSK